MAKGSGRRVTGAWGNALGGFRRQKRNNYGQFSRTGGTVKRAKTPTFKKGGSPRYYAPGGKTYSTTRGGVNGFAPSQGTRSTAAKQARRQAGYENMMAKKAKEARSAKRKKIAAVAIGAAAVVGGAYAMKKYSANGRQGPIAAHPPRVQPRSALTSGAQSVNGRPAISPDQINRVGARANDFRTSNSSRRAGVTPPSADPTPDDGHSPGKARVLALASGMTTATSILRNAQNVQAEMKRMSNLNRTIGQDGVAEEERHAPIRQKNLQSFDDFSNLADLNNARNRHESLGVQSSYKDPRFIVEDARDMGPHLSRGTVKGARGYIRTLAEGDYDEHTPEQRVVNDKYGDATVASNTDWRGNAARRSQKDPDFKSGFSARDIHGTTSTDAEYMAQVAAAQEVSGGVGNWANKKPRDLAAEGMKAVPLSGVKSAVGTARKVTGDSVPQKWDSEAYDASIRYERRQAARAGLSETHGHAFQTSNKDSIKYDAQGEAVERVKFQESQVEKEMKVLRDSQGDNPFWTGDFDPDEGPITNLAVRGSITGQPVPKTMDLKAPKAIYKDPTTGEKAAEAFLEDFARRAASGNVSRYDRQMKAFLIGERATPPQRPEAMRNKLPRDVNARINRNARTRSAKKAKG